MDGGGDQSSFLEAKGRIAAASTFTRNEILASINQPADFILAIVRVPVFPEMGAEDARNVGDMDPVSGTPADCEVYYVRQPFGREPGFAEHSVIYDLGKLVGMGERMAIQELTGQPAQRQQEPWTLRTCP